MRIVRLAKIFERKYNLKSEAASIQEVINDVKKDLINTYNLYVNSDKAKESILQLLANAGEPFCKALVFEFEKMIGNIDQLASEPSKLFKEVNRILGAINEVKSDPDKKVRNFIHDSIRATKESERNYREHLKSKFEMILYRLSSVLEKQGKILKAFLPQETPLAGSIVEPQRKELSKEKLLMFMRSPPAQKYGLDNIEIMTKLLSYPETKQKLTTLINAVDRGHIPVNSPAIILEVAAIKKWLDEKETNFPALEEAPEKSAPAVSLFEEET